MIQLNNSEIQKLTFQQLKKITLQESNKKKKLESIKDMIDWI